MENNVQQLTVKEKVSLTTGKGNWETHHIEGKLPAIRMQDGPHGLRIQEGDGNDINGQGEATVCFPAACLSAASFDKDLLKSLGRELGKECIAKGVNLLLGPGINIKRNPLCGRNFEYYSEDPLVSGVLGSAFVQGVQENGVGACVKHFFANNQEYRRMNSSSNLDERTAHEIYLSAFERVVKEAKPWAIMAAYNKVNGEYCTENKEILTDILRKEWGYEGTVISDWGAVHDRAKAIAAGCDLTMPGDDMDGKVECAYLEGNITAEELDNAANNVMNLVEKSKGNQLNELEFDYESGHRLAEQIAEESIILLKNHEKILPLNPKEKIAYIGKFAKNPRYQGGGSSHISCKEIDNALEESEKLVCDKEILFAKGYENDEIDEKLISQAVELAKTVEKVVLFVGLSDEMESEGFDRKNMKMPESHLALIESVCEVQEKVVVILHNGAPIEMPWLEQVKGVVEVYLGGEAIGKAVSNVLFGKTNPSGRLPETYPLYEQDVPSYLYYGGENGQVDYNEKMFVGYRYYTSVGRKVAFPFGHGLSYTDFKYRKISISQSSIVENQKIDVYVEVENDGDMDGKEVVQIYIEPPKGEYKRPVRELKGFEKIFLKSREQKTVQIKLEYRDFACYSPEKKQWYAQPGEYQIALGKSAEDIIKRVLVIVQGEELILTEKFDANTMLKEFIRHPLGKDFFDTHIEQMIKGMCEAGLIPAEMAEEALKIDNSQSNEGLLDQTVSLLFDFSGVTEQEREGLFQLMNQ